MSFLDIIFPKRCINCKKFGDFLCPSCFSLISYDVLPICPICNKNSIDGAVHPICKTKFCLDGLTCGVVYKGVVRKLIYKFKYNPYLSSLKEIIAKLLYESLIQNEIFYQKVEKRPIVIPVPLHKNKERKRGYNHVFFIANYVAKYFSLEFYDNALIRVKDTKPQYKLDKESRQKNLKDAFEINPKFKDKIAGFEILLIDDVATTCTTLNECAKILKKSGAKAVWGIAFARER